MTIIITIRAKGLKQDDILPVLRERLIQALTPSDPTQSGLLFSEDTNEPTVIFVIGANGMGKTTTIGKLSSRLQNEANVSVILGACDTFRAAAVEQLGEWALRANVSIEIPNAEEQSGDPVPVVTRTLQRAKKQGFDVAIIDTSGRLSNNFELIEQLQAMKAAIQKENPRAPHETLLVVDGSVGRNAVEQASAWRKYVGVSGLAITKLDGTARGGFVVSVVKDLGIPVKLIGVGEKIDDLRDFQPEQFVDALLGNNDKDIARLTAKANKIFEVTAALDNNNGDNNSNDNGDSDTEEAFGAFQPSGAFANNDPASRLRSSFNQNNNNNNNNSNEIKTINKPKRQKRVKPAQQKKKKKK